jgi:hypothetical protein
MLDQWDEDLERLVPRKIMLATWHLHNLIYIRYFYESLGQQPPTWVKNEMERSQGALTEELEREKGQGGRLYKPREGVKL